MLGLARPALLDGSSSCGTQWSLLIAPERAVIVPRILMKRVVFLAGIIEKLKGLVGKDNTTGPSIICSRYRLPVVQCSK